MALVWTIVIIIILIISWTYKKVDSAVDEYKLERNPNDIKTLEKYFLKYLESDNQIQALEICNKILLTNPSHTLCLFFISVYHYEKGEYQESEKILKKTLIENFDRETEKKFQYKYAGHDVTIKLAAKAFYYYGHILYKNGNQIEAEVWKKKVKSYNRGVLRKKLY